MNNEKIVKVKRIQDLPASVDGVVTLDPGVTYVFEQPVWLSPSEFIRKYTGGPLRVSEH